MSECFCRSSAEATPDRPAPAAQPAIPTDQAAWGLADQRMASAPGAADTFDRQSRRVQFADALHDGDPRKAAGPADQGHPAIANLRRFGGGQHSPGPLVKVRPEMLQLPAHISKRYHALMDNITPLSCKGYLLTTPYLPPSAGIISNDGESYSLRLRQSSPKIGHWIYSMSSLGDAALSSVLISFCNP